MGTLQNRSEEYQNRIHAADVTSELPASLTQNETARSDLRSSQPTAIPIVCTKHSNMLLWLLN